MITDLVIGFLSDVAHYLLGLLPTVTPPTWLSQSGPVSTVFGYAGSMGAWFPTALALSVLTAVLAAWAAGFLVKGVRIVASFLTLGGGSAA